jgi:hypothetical protein
MPQRIYKKCVALIESQTNIPGLRIAVAWPLIRASSVDATNSRSIGVQMVFLRLGLLQAGSRHGKRSL